MKLPSFFPSAVSICLIRSTITSQKDESKIYVLLSSLLAWVHFTSLSTRPILLDVLFIPLFQYVQNKILFLSHLLFFLHLLFSICGDDIIILSSFAQAPNLSFLLTYFSLVSSFWSISCLTVALLFHSYAIILNSRLAFAQTAGIAS